jgi:pimeloyl-ACP methyl ester carboxylesterase
MTAAKAVDTLKVPGATLHYEITGTGPVLLLIPGAPADCAVFGGLVAGLSDRYTVVTYDPRGYSRSPLDVPDEDQKISVHGEDPHYVLEAITSEPAYVLGCSGGALAGLELVARHPEQVRTLVAHEPPASELLPNAADWNAFWTDVNQTYQQAGPGPAMGKFIAGVSGFGPHLPAELPPLPFEAPDPNFQPPPEVMEMMARMEKNSQFFVAHQITSLIGYKPDVAAIKAAPAKVVVAVGDASGGQVAHDSAVALASALGSEPLTVPGDHQGFATNSPEWAELLHEVFSG